MIQLEKNTFNILGKWRYWPDKYTFKRWRGDMMLRVLIVRGLREWEGWTPNGIVWVTRLQYCRYTELETWPVLLKNIYRTVKYYVGGFTPIYFTFVKS